MDSDTIQVSGLDKSSLAALRAQAKKPGMSAEGYANHFVEVPAHVREGILSAAATFRTCYGAAPVLTVSGSSSRMPAKRVKS